MLKSKLLSGREPALYPADLMIKNAQFQRRCCQAFYGILIVLASATAAWARSTAAPYLSRSGDWFRSADGLRIATNILSWQDLYGSWPKNTNTTDFPFAGDRHTIQGTFDNEATTDEMRFLARAYNATNIPAFKESFGQGLDCILKAQYPTGGWPQSYPPDQQYHRRITFNDDAMVRVLLFIRDVATNQQARFGFVDAERRQAAARSFDRGIECILKCQVVVDGKKTVWCAQHDEMDYAPRIGRSYELPSLSGSESAGILELLMSLDHPSPQIIAAINSGAAWFEKSKINGIRIRVVNGDRQVEQDPAAPPLWARFYEIDTNRPFFSGRDGVKKYAFSEIEAERRNGYSWYGNWGAKILQDYPKWKSARGIKN